jgi:hypothetical protein
MKRLLMRLSRKAGISCAEVHELVQSELDGELPEGPKRDRLIAHLERCRPCGVEAEVYERIKASLAAEPPSGSIARLTEFALAIPARPDLAEDVDGP